MIKNFKNAHNLFYRQSQRRLHIGHASASSESLEWLRSGKRSSANTQAGFAEVCSSTSASSHHLSSLSFKFSFLSLFFFNIFHSSISCLARSSSRLRVPASHPPAIRQPSTRHPAAYSISALLISDSHSKIYTPNSVIYVHGSWLLPFGKMELSPHWHLIASMLSANVEIVTKHLKIWTFLNRNRT